MIQSNIKVMDRTKYCKSIDQVPQEVLYSEKNLTFKSRDLSSDKILKDMINYTPEGYCSISLMKRVNTLKNIAKKHIKAQSVER